MNRTIKFLASVAPILIILTISGVAFAQGADADRIMPTTFASMSRKEGWRQRVPFHHKPVRAGTPAKTIARVKPKESAKRKRKGEGAKG